MEQYDPQKVIVTFGPIIIAGYADGTFVKATRTEDGFSMETGADGGVCRVKNANRSGNFEVTLRQTAMTNDLLSAVSITDEQTSLGVFPFLIKDLGGVALAAARNSWIRKISDMERAKQGSTVVWTFDSDLIRIVNAGSILSVL